MSADGQMKYLGVRLRRFAAVLMNGLPAPASLTLQYRLIKNKNAVVAGGVGCVLLKSPTSIFPCRPLSNIASLKSVVYMRVNRPSWRRLAAHAMTFAAFRALFKAGSKTEMSSAMIPITTSSSTNVKPRDERPAEIL